MSAAPAEGGTESPARGFTTGTERIRALNGHLRRTTAGGRVMLTQGIASLPLNELAVVMDAVRRFDAFDDGNDPHHEHDFGTLTVLGRDVLWKIDYYDRALEFGSEDPADEAVTTRVMTVMLAEEF